MRMYGCSIRKFPVSAAKTKKTYKIAIDAGHQGKGNGKTGTYRTGREDA